MNDRQTQRDASLARIRALTQKTVANGCTEAEAQAAAAMVDKLLALYEIELDEIALRSEQEIMKSEIATGLHEVRIAAPNIATFTDTKVWTVEGRDLAFLGFEVDVSVAEYLVMLFMRAIDRESGGYTMFNADYAMTDPPGQRNMLASFRIGCAARLGERLVELKSKRDFTARSSGRDLVAMKRPLIEEAFATLGIELTRRAVGGSIRHDGAFVAGRNAADTVSISQGVHGYGGRSKGIR